MALEHLGQALTASYAIEGGTARLYERGYHSCTTSSEEPPISLRHESWSTTSKATRSAVPRRTTSRSLNMQGSDSSSIISLPKGGGALAVWREIFSSSSDGTGNLCRPIFSPAGPGRLSATAQLGLQHGQWEWSVRTRDGAWASQASPVRLRKASRVTTKAAPTTIHTRTSFCFPARRTSCRFLVNTRAVLTIGPALKVCSPASSTCAMERITSGSPHQRRTR